MSISQAKSITHQHLLCCINTEIAGIGNEIRKIRILDVGCGDGELISYLYQNLPVINPNIHFEIFGFDVGDHGVQDNGFLEKTKRNLAAIASGPDWNQQVTSIRQEDTWPYSEGYFDIIISNQVGEHVRDHDFFFSEIKRTLRPMGFSLHLFPLKEYVFEGHVFLPFAHWIDDFDHLYFYIKLLSQLGFGKFKQHHKETGVSIVEYSERHADYLFHFTNYLKKNDVVRQAKRVGLRASFRHTLGFYLLKILSLFGVNNIYRYNTILPPPLDWLTFKLCKRISCITLLLVNKEVYTSETQAFLPRAE